MAADFENRGSLEFFMGLVTSCGVPKVLFLLASLTLGTRVVSSYVPFWLALGTVLALRGILVLLVHTRRQLL